MSEGSRAQTLLYGTLTVLGLSFWFFLGYPYANHNESFVIVTQLEQMDFADVLVDRIYPVATYRPLGQAVAWLGYRLGGGTGTIVQLFNYIGAVIAWLALYAALRERKVLSYAALITGGALFSGYIYLFHLHGVFYSPLLVLVALLFLLDGHTITRGRLWAIALFALLATLFHPYAFPIFLAALVGFVVERPVEFGAFARPVIVAVTGAVVLFLAMVFVPQHDRMMSVADMVAGLIASYRMVEVNALVSAVVAGLTLLTAWSCPVQGTARGVLLTASLAGIAAAVVLGVPILFVWIVLTVIKTVLLKKWWLVFIIAGTAMLPAPSATGSPTYTVFVLMACTGAFAIGWKDAEERLSSWGDWVAVCVVVVALFAFGAARSGLGVPILSTVVRPFLAEQEKTYQLEEIVAWLVQSEYATFEPILVAKTGNPRSASDAVNRTYRPPTVQEYLHKYARYKRGRDPLPGRVLLVSFGGQEVPGGTIVHTVAGRNAGPALVFLPPP